MNKKEGIPMIQQHMLGVLLNLLADDHDHINPRFFDKLRYDDQLIVELNFAVYLELILELTRDKTSKQRRRRKSLLVLPFFLVEHGKILLSSTILAQFPKVLVVVATKNKGTNSMF